jgi:PEP-CTERM motif
LLKIDQNGHHSDLKPTNSNKTMNKKILLIIAVFASVALTARANLVTNPGFETGSFSGWTQFGDTGFTAVAPSSPGGIPPHSGNFLAYFGPFSDGGIQQTLTGPAGAYSVDFWLAADGGDGGDYINVTLNGTSIYMAPGSGGFGFTHIIAAGSSATPNPVLAFHFINVPSYWDLDDVNAVVVPEPGTLGLIALGGLGLVAALRKRLV